MLARGKTAAGGFATIRVNDDGEVVVSGLSDVIAGTTAPLGMWKPVSDDRYLVQKWVEGGIVLNIDPQVCQEAKIIADPGNTANIYVGMFTDEHDVTCLNSQPLEPGQTEVVDRIGNTGDIAVTSDADGQYVRVMWR